MQAKQAESKQANRGAALHVVMATFGSSGGLIQYPAQLANALSQLVEVTVFVPAATDSAALFSNRVEVVEYDKDSLLFPLTFLYRFCSLVMRRRPDVVHLPFYDWKIGVLPPLMRLAGSATIGTIHDPESHVDHCVSFLGVDVDVHGHLRAFFATAMNRLIIHGDRTCEQAVRMGYPHEKLRIVPHGLYSQFAAYDQSFPEELPDRYLLFFGTVRENKGFDLVPDIVAGVNNRVEESVAGVVAGAPGIPAEWGEHTLEEMAAAKNVQVYDGYVPEGHVRPLFENATIAVLPYRDASMSGVAMIAYTFDTPMVVTDTGDVGRIVGKDGAGLIAAVDDVEDISKKIAKLVDNEDCREAIRNSIRQCKEQYSWDRIAERTVEIYQEAIGPTSK